MKVTKYKSISTSFIILFSYCFFLESTDDDFSADSDDDFIPLNDDNSSTSSSSDDEVAAVQNEVISHTDLNAEYSTENNVAGSSLERVKTRRSSYKKSPGRKRMVHQKDWIRNKEKSMLTIQASVSKNLMVKRNLVDL